MSIRSTSRRPLGSNRHSATRSAFSEYGAKLPPRRSKVARRGEGSPRQTVLTAVTARGGVFIAGDGQRGLRRPSRLVSLLGRYRTHGRELLEQPRQRNAHPFRAMGELVPQLVEHFLKREELQETAGHVVVVGIRRGALDPLAIGV